MDASTIQVISILISVVAFAYAAWLFMWVKRQPPDNEKIRKVGILIRDGARTFLKKEYIVLAKFAGVSLAASLMSTLFLTMNLFH